MARPRRYTGGYYRRKAQEAAKTSGGLFGKKKTEKKGPVTITYPSGETRVFDSKPKSGRIIVKKDQKQISAPVAPVTPKATVAPKPVRTTPSQGAAKKSVKVAPVRPAENAGATTKPVSKPSTAALKEQVKVTPKGVGAALTAAAAAGGAALGARYKKEGAKVIRSAARGAGARLRRAGGALSEAYDKYVPKNTGEEASKPGRASKVSTARAGRAARTTTAKPVPRKKAGGAKASIVAAPKRKAAPRKKTSTLRKTTAESQPDVSKAARAQESPSKGGIDKTVAPKKGRTVKANIPKPKPAIPETAAAEVKTEGKKAKGGQIVKANMPKAGHLGLAKSTVRTEPISHLSDEQKRVIRAKLPKTQPTQTETQVVRGGKTETVTTESRARTSGGKGGPGGTRRVIKAKLPTNVEDAARPTGGKGGPGGTRRVIKAKLPTNVEDAARPTGGKGVESRPLPVRARAAPTETSLTKRQLEQERKGALAEARRGRTGGPGNQKVPIPRGLERPAPAPKSYEMAPEQVQKPSKELPSKTARLAKATQVSPSQALGTKAKAQSDAARKAAIEEHMKTKGYTKVNVEGDEVKTEKVKPRTTKERTPGKQQAPKPKVIKRASFTRMFKEDPLPKQVQEIMKAPRSPDEARLNDRELMKARQAKASRYIRNAARVAGRIGRGTSKAIAPIGLFSMFMDFKRQLDEIKKAKKKSGKRGLVFERGEL